MNSECKNGVDALFVFFSQIKFKDSRPADVQSSKYFKITRPLQILVYIWDYKDRAS